MVNAATSISGRYPNLGPEILVSAGIPLLAAGVASTSGVVESSDASSVASDSGDIAFFDLSFFHTSRDLPDDI